MHTIIYTSCLVAVALSFYAMGRRAERKTNESDLIIKVAEMGFPSLVTVPRGKTVRIKNTGKVRIVVIPDANSYLEASEKSDKK